MKYLFTILQNLFSKTNQKPMPLGRWKILDCRRKMKEKVDLSNEDHCGPCGQYAMKKTLQETKEKPKIES